MPNPENSPSLFAEGCAELILMDLMVRQYSKTKANTNLDHPVVIAALDISEVVKN